MLAFNAPKNAPGYLTMSMYPPPAPSVLQGLVGNVVGVITFGMYTVHVCFEGGNQISIASPFRFAKRESVEAAQLNDFPLVSSGLMRVIDCSVSAAACESDGTLSLQFSNGDALVVYAPEPNYESYTLLIDGEQHIV